MTSLAELIFFCLVGRIFIYLWMEFPLPQRVDNIKFIHDLKQCDLCSGVYLFSVLSGLLHIDLIQMLGMSGFPVINQILTGGIVSFLVHLISLGWKAKFEVIVI